MGCATSACAVVGSKNKRSIIQESVVFVLQLRVPVQTDLQRQLKGVASKTTIDRLACLRNQIQLVAEDSGIEEMRPSCFFLLAFQEKGSDFEHNIQSLVLNF
ncbi:unnamed protein product, partial [Brassica rapa]